MSITKILPHPLFLIEGWRSDVKFLCGYDIAIAEVEISKGSSHLTEEEIDEL